jgi:5-methylcytosine-specific restriction enzyme subunit McrC
LNVFEFKHLKSSELPKSWNNRDNLEKLEFFLQQNWDSRKIFYDDQLSMSKQQFLDFDSKDGLNTKNYIGTIFFEGEQLNIFPKMFKNNQEDIRTDVLNFDELLENLIYWLGFNDKLNFPFIKMKNDFSDSNSLIELIITIYIQYIKSSIQKARYFQYEDVTEISTTIKGKMNVIDFLRKRDFRNDFSHPECSYSSFLFDNKVNQIIKHTLKKILRISSKKSNIEIIRSLLKRFSDVTDSSFTPYDCETNRLSNLNSNYSTILSLSKIFLLNKSVEFRDGSNNNFSFLFPAELLYEGFVGSYIKEVLNDDAKITFQSTQNFLTEIEVNNTIIDSAFMLKEDIVVDINDTFFILDSKYKGIDNLDNVFVNKKLDINDNDMKQILIYAIRRNAKRVALVYPLYKNEKLSDNRIVFKMAYDLDGKKVNLPVHIIKIPFIMTNFNEENLKVKSLLKDFFYK